MKVISEEAETQFVDCLTKIAAIAERWDVACEHFQRDEDGFGACLFAQSTDEPVCECSMETGPTCDFEAAMNQPTDALAEWCQIEENND